VRLRHPPVGEPQVIHETFPLLDSLDQMMVTCHAEPGGGFRRGTAAPDQAAKTPIR
jgi:hypothetical protein